jgi:hypothetical protein
VRGKFPGLNIGTGGEIVKLFFVSARYANRWAVVRGPARAELQRASCPRHRRSVLRPCLLLIAAVSAATSPASPGAAAGEPAHMVEAEAMTLHGYVIEPSADPLISGGELIACHAPSEACAAGWRFAGPPGTYDLHVTYVDRPGGAARFTLWAAHRHVESWVADERSPGGTREPLLRTRVLPRVTLGTGAFVRVDTEADRDDNAALDVVRLERSPPD